MNIPSTLAKIRIGEDLSADELGNFARGLASGQVSDAQAGAFAMAVCVHGLSELERIDLTLAMRDRGEVQQCNLPGPVLDKHSTGGVGDNVSLVLAPALAACGAFIPMVSGRGLGHTGGTLDKLEAIPGYRTQLTTEEFSRIVTEVGCAIVGAGENMAPADKRLYAIRDITSTVESMDLITASILSKKLSAGLEGLILDVKVGNGAFISDPKEARNLARFLVDGANGAGCKTSALLTDMEQPLARAAGNSLETRNAIELLIGSKDDTRVRAVTLALGGRLLFSVGLVNNIEEGESQISQVLENGAAAEYFARMVSSLGGPTDILENYYTHLPQASTVIDLVAEEKGYISEIDVRGIGEVVIELGGGRIQQNDVLDFSVGLDQLTQLGQLVELGSVLARIHAKDMESARSVSEKVRSCFIITSVLPNKIPMIGELID